MIEEYIRKRENLVSLFVLIDSRHEPQKADIEFINELGKWQVPFALVFTKSDKNKPGATQRNVSDFIDVNERELGRAAAAFCHISLSKEGRRAMLGIYRWFIP